MKSKEIFPIEERYNENTIKHLTNTSIVLLYHKALEAAEQLAPALA